MKKLKNYQKKRKIKNKMTYYQIVGVYGGYSRGYNVRIQLRDSEQEVYILQIYLYI